MEKIFNFGIQYHPLQLWGRSKKVKYDYKWMFATITSILNNIS